MPSLPCCLVLISAVDAALDAEVLVDRPYPPLAAEDDVLVEVAGALAELLLLLPPQPAITTATATAITARTRRFRISSSQHFGSFTYTDARAAETLPQIAT